MTETIIVIAHNFRGPAIWEWLAWAALVWAAVTWRLDPLRTYLRDGSLSWPVIGAFPLASLSVLTIWQPASRRVNDPRRQPGEAMSFLWPSLEGHTKPLGKYSYLSRRSSLCSVGGHEYQEGGSFGSTMEADSPPSYFFYSPHLTSPSFLSIYIVSIFCYYLECTFLF